MTNLPGATASPSFDTPLEMLRACHSRIMDQCDTLKKLQLHLPEHGSDVQARQAAQAIMRYFDTAGQYHHQDEEEDLFPLLLASGSNEAHALVRRLLGDHREMNAAWLVLRLRLSAIAEGQSDMLENTVVEKFSDAYARHITLENVQLLPLSAQLLNQQALNELGRKIAARRGVTLSAG